MPKFSNLNYGSNNSSSNYTPSPPRSPPRTRSQTRRSTRNQSSAGSRASSSGPSRSAVVRFGRRSVRGARRQSVLIALLLATIAAVTAPSLMIAIRQQQKAFALQVMEIDFNRKFSTRDLQQRFEYESLLLNTMHKYRMTELQQLALAVNKNSNKVAINLMKQQTQHKQMKNRETSRAVAANSIRQVMNLPVQAVSLLTGLSKKSISVIDSISNDASKTVKGLSKGMSRTANFLGPFAFVLTMVAIMANGSVSKAQIDEILIKLKDMIKRGTPMTKKILVGIFKSLYSSTKTLSRRMKNYMDKHKKRRERHARRVRGVRTASL